MKKRRTLTTMSILPLFILCLVSAFFYVSIDVCASDTITPSLVGISHQNVTVWSDTTISHGNEYTTCQSNSVLPYNLHGSEYYSYDYSFLMAYFDQSVFSDNAELDFNFGSTYTYSGVVDYCIYPSSIEDFNFPSVSVSFSSPLINLGTADMYSGSVSFTVSVNDLILSDSYSGYVVAVKIPQSRSSSFTSCTIGRTIPIIKPTPDPQPGDNGYPCLISDVLFSDMSGGYIGCYDNTCNYSEGFAYLTGIYDSQGYSIDLDPSHTYYFQFDITYSPPAKISANYSHYLLIGSKSFPIAGTTSFFVSGDSISNYVDIKTIATDIYSTSYPVYDYFLFSGSMKVYDFGSTGNIENIIDNQTDNITNGFDSSSGSESHSKFVDGVADYETAEDSLFTSAKSGMDDYDFFDFSSIPAMLTGLSFVTSIMTSIFNSMGGASGAGIVLSVLFSVMLVAMAIGLYRYFVSSGKTDDKKGGD